jgi:hypothetical protein
MSTNIKKLNDEEQSTELTEEDQWYTDIGTEEEKEIIEDSEPYFFVN